MNTQNWQPFVRVQSPDGNGESSITVSEIQFGDGDGVRKILDSPIEVSTGKTRSHDPARSTAIVQFSRTSNGATTVTTEGTGRVDSLDQQFSPKLVVPSKKKRKCSKHGFYAELRVKIQDSEIVNGKALEYFDLVLGEAKSVRADMPHFGFRPNGSAHFFVKTNQLNAEHISHGEYLTASQCIVPKSIEIKLKQSALKVVIQFSVEPSSGSVVADTIDILLDSTPA
jgi:hypothetical protein